MRTQFAIFTLIVVLVAGTLQAQKRTTSIDFKFAGVHKCDVFRDKPEELSSKYISFYGGTDHTGFTFTIAYEKFGRKWYYGGAGYGFLNAFGASVSGAYFFKTFEKPANLRVSADFMVGNGASTPGRPLGRFKTTKELRFGFHAQAFYLTFPETSWSEYIHNNLYVFSKPQYATIALGLAYSSVVGADLKLTKYIGKTKRSLIAFDVLLTPYFSTNITSTDSASQADIGQVPSRDLGYSPIGFHFFIQKHYGGTYHYSKAPDMKMGFFWRAGVIKPPYSNVFNAFVRAGRTVLPELVLGLYFNFD